MTVKTISQFEESSSPSFQRQPNSCQRILVVNHEADLRRLNTEVLTNSGYQVDAAEDGVVAWDMLQDNRYDLLVTDKNMPKVSGVELLQKLHDAGMELPTIMVTGALPQEQLNRHPWLQIEAKAVLHKPYTLDELLGVAKNALHAANNRRTKIAPPNWQPQPVTVGLEF